MQVPIELLIVVVTPRRNRTYCCSALCRWSHRPTCVSPRGPAVLDPLAF